MIMAFLRGVGIGVLFLVAVILIGELAVLVMAS
jgi:hypothetical protein